MSWKRPPPQGQAPNPLRWDLDAEVTVTLRHSTRGRDTLVVSSATPMTREQLWKMVEQKREALLRRHMELTFLLTHLEYDAVEGLVSSSSTPETEEKSATPPR